ncbi:lipocalin family protein [Capnocytophaga sputigena]|uniref:lipocalin family protein n=1 Tax=Capnocytophaga sputigena TaxID=1019 RepID=UPI0028EF6479|nr:lipocalin family protein [Capnocytophaga sputigena]
MKNLLKMAFIAVAIFVTSCGKSDDGVSNKDLVGTWYLESATINGEVQPYTDCEKRTNIVFTTTEFSSVGYATENDTCTELGRNSGTYTVSGNTIFYKKQDGSSYSSEISLSGNKLTITQTKKDESDKEVTGTTVYIKR